MHRDVWNPEASLGRSDTLRPMPSPRQQAATLPWRQDAYSTAFPYPWPVSFPITFHSNRKKGFKNHHCLALQSVNLYFSDLPRWRARSGDAWGPSSVLGREGRHRTLGPARPNTSPTRKDGKTRGSFPWGKEGSREQVNRFQIVEWLSGGKWFLSFWVQHVE